MTSTGHAAHATAPARVAAASATPMCLDAGRPPRRDKGVVTIWRCEAGNSNQVWATFGGQVEVKDTIATATPMCLDAGRPPRRDKGVVTLWKCEAGNSNQVWVNDGGQVKVKDTLS